MITTRDGLVAAIAGAQDLIIQKASITTVANQWSSLLAAVGNPGAGSLTVGNTANGLVPTDSLPGAPLITDFTSGNQGYITGLDAKNTVISTMRIYDRLFHVGSISALTLATTTLATVPSYLGRVPTVQSGGRGLELWLEVNAAISATATTVTVSYTNEAGVAGRTATLEANISGLIAASMRPFRLQAGDKGVRSVESITVGGTVATSGTFNVVVCRPLGDHNILAPSLSEPRQDAFRAGMPQVYQDSCICAMILTQGTASGILYYDLDIAQG
jgi:hypothetical protein